MTPSPSLPPVMAYRPSTFRERGVAVPFTSPLLAGARARQGERVRVELVLPNPSGGGGVYILPWASVRLLFHPSVHDSRLYKLLVGIPELTPSAVRSAGIEIARLGLAGRQAMAAALAAKTKDEEERLLTNLLLLVTLAEQAEPGGIGRISHDGRHSLEIERRASEIVARIAPRLDRSPRDIKISLSAMTDLFSPTGVALQSNYARVPRLLARMNQLRAELADWAQDHPQNMHIDLADMIGSFADTTINTTKTTLSKVWAMTHDMTGLLRSWGRSPERVSELTARPEWLLDGWEQVCLLWNACATPEQRCAAITEMAQLVPVLPREIADWVAVRTDLPGDAASQTVLLNKDRRTGSAVLRLTARNERMRAFAM